MISEIVGDKKSVNLVYPCLKEYENYNNHIVVIFTKYDSGMIVYANPNNVNKDWVKGFISDCWGEETFNVFKNDLVLRND